MQASIFFEIARTTRLQAQTCDKELNVAKKRKRKKQGLN